MVPGTFAGSLYLLVITVGCVGVLVHVVAAEIESEFGEFIGFASGVVGGFTGICLALFS